MQVPGSHLVARGRPQSEVGEGWEFPFCLKAVLSLFKKKWWKIFLGVLRCDQFFLTNVFVVAFMLHLFDCYGRPFLIGLKKATCAICSAIANKNYSMIIEPVLSFLHAVSRGSL